MLTLLTQYTKKDNNNKSIINPQTSEKNPPIQNLNGPKKEIPQKKSQRWEDGKISDSNRKVCELPSKGRWQAEKDTSDNYGVNSNQHQKNYITTSSTSKQKIPIENDDSSPERTCTEEEEDFHQEEQKKPEKEIEKKAPQKNHLFKKKQEEEKKKKTKYDKFRAWGESRLVYIEFPERLENNPSARFKVGFKFKDSNDGKLKRKTVKFGKKGFEYLIDHQDTERNKKWLNKQRGFYTPFHKNFWIVNLLCSEKTLQQAYNRCLSVLLVDE